MKLALLQHVSPAGDSEAAFAVLGPMLTAAGAAGAAMLTVPETFIPGYNVADPAQHALIRDEATALAAPLCRAAGCGLVLGYAERDGNALYNSALAIDATGHELANYRKIQLFGPREKALYTAGDAYAVFELEGTKAAMLICYDIEFYQHVAELRRRGVDVVLVPTANMLPYSHVSHATVPAHAANGQVSIVYANFCGREGDLHYAGQSVIVGPHGELLAQAGDLPALLVAEIPRLDPARAYDQIADFRSAV